MPGKNVSKLMAYFIAREAVPPGGGISSALDFFMDDARRKEILEKATSEMVKFLDAIKNAPDNPYGDDDELIAGALLKKIDEKKRARKG